MAIPITTFTILTMAIPMVALIGFIDKNKVLAIFPFMGGIMGFIIYNYLAADGQVIVSASNYTDYPLILIPLFMSFGDLALCAYKVSPASKVIETLFLGFGLFGIDAYFVPTETSGLATTANPNLPPVMLGFVQNYGEVFSVGISAILMVYVIWSFWFK